MWPCEAIASIVVPRYPCSINMWRAMVSSSEASLPRGRPRRAAAGLGDMHAFSTWQYENLPALSYSHVLNTGGHVVGPGIVTAAVAAFVLSSVYYVAATPLERRVVGDAALDRGRPQVWKVLTELLRTALVASAFAWIARQTGDMRVGDTVMLALITWIGFPLFCSPAR